MHKSVVPSTKKTSNNAQVITGGKVLGYLSADVMGPQLWCTTLGGNTGRMLRGKMKAPWVVAAPSDQRNHSDESTKRFKFLCRETEDEVRGPCACRSIRRAAVADEPHLERTVITQGAAMTTCFGCMRFLKSCLYNYKAPTYYSCMKLEFCYSEKAVAMSYFLMWQVHIYVHWCDQ